MGNKGISTDSFTVESTLQLSKKISGPIVSIPETPSFSKSEEGNSLSEPLSNELSSKRSKCEEDDQIRLEPDTEDSYTEVALLGSEGVGKSSIITQYIEEKFVVYSNPSLQSSLRFFHKNESICDEVKELRIYDLIGNEEWSSIQYYISRLEGLIVVFDLTDRPSFEHAKKLCRIVTESISTKMKDPFQDEEEKEGEDEDQEKENKWHLGKMLLGNKVDDKENRKITKEEAEEIANEFDFHYLECSAKDDINIKNAFVEVLEVHAPFPL